jgi:hypothetical protein
MNILTLEDCQQNKLRITCYVDLPNKWNKYLQYKWLTTKRNFYATLICQRILQLMSDNYRNNQYETHTYMLKNDENKL